MTRTTLLALAAAAALAGCNRDDHTIITEPGGRDPMAEALANAGPVELPPAIQASRIYRCRDNSLVYIDWMADGRTANYRPERGASPVMLRAPEPGEPLVAEGYSLTGSAEGSTITITRPDQGEQSCRA